MHSIASARSPTESLQRYDAGRRFVRRLYAPRTIGFALGAMAIGGVLWAEAAHPGLWLALALSCLVWPHVAFQLGRRSADPYRRELRNLMVDSALGGVWIALMKFNLLPSVVLFSMLSMDKFAVGGTKFLLRCSAAMLAAGAAVVAAFGFELRQETSMRQMLASLPLLVIYPMIVGVTTYDLARRVRAQNRQLAELSRTDGLSGLLNRISWEEAVAAEFQRCRRSGRPASLLMLDIDHFKAINDRHGHPVGDEVIRTVAAILRRALRLQDIPGRYGGEEFGVILPDTAALAAEVIAERVRQLIESSVLEPAVGIRATASIGIAELERLDAEYGEWISHADRALYAAKDRGRNRVELYDPTAQPAAAA